MLGQNQHQMLMLSFSILLLLLSVYENEYVLCIPSWSTPRACHNKLFIFIGVYVFYGRTANLVNNWKNFFLFSVIMMFYNI